MHIRDKKIATIHRERLMVEYNSLAEMGTHRRSMIDDGYEVIDMSVADRTLAYECEISISTIDAVRNLLNNPMAAGAYRVGITDTLDALGIRISTLGAQEDASDRVQDHTDRTHKDEV